MPAPTGLMRDLTFTPMTLPRLVEGLLRLGIEPGAVLMVHVRMSAFRWVVGGIDTVVEALREAVGPSGTLLAFTGWEDSPYHVPMWDDWPEWQAAYRAHQPAFDPAVSSARRDFGRFPERLRTWPGSRRSAHPEVSFAALGPGAALLLADQRDDDPFGIDSPLERLCERDGQVLLLGAPLSRLTLCHHAEALTDLPSRRFHTFRAPVAGVGLREYRMIDTFYGAFPYYEDGRGIDSPPRTMAEQAVAAGAGRCTQIGAATTWLFESRPTVAAVRMWLEREFG
ncbi:aminoglycoside N(3)-acetyltransferase [Actinopolymorpha rutila]|uniref:Aminoglycoside N(3)-acetyltransferase n=1 Tax=Actinopolymorpha rutila TaxID=446787 RepID=A0A852ZUZ8_9ACTN|nr:AAC(3) family N-acetyltransferase [Actinopolymorpha rutila]NYH92800.1 aminoglycoside 3-N-acetyltransferase [Actinopolymorpha rutila]